MLWKSRRHPRGSLATLNDHKKNAVSTMQAIWYSMGNLLVSIGRGWGANAELRCLKRQLHTRNRGFVSKQ
jgi:hypothetical protein